MHDHTPHSTETSQPIKQRAVVESDAPKERDSRSLNKKNLGTIERILRVLLGGALAIWAVLLLVGSGSLVWWLLDVALIALGVDFVITGIRGYCPLYQRLGWSTARPQTRN